MPGRITADLVVTAGSDRRIVGRRALFATLVLLTIAVLLALAAYALSAGGFGTADALLLLFFGLNQFLVAIFVFAAAFSLFANLEVGRRIIKGNPKYAGGSIAHVGLAIMFLGFVSSSVYDEKQTVSLSQGKATDVMGYRLTYKGYSPIDQEKFAFHVNVEKGGLNETVSPIMYVSSYSQGLMRNPDIINLVTKDFYVAPLSLESSSSENSSAAEHIELKKGEKKSSGGMTIQFVDFDFPATEKAAMLEGREVKIGATLKVQEGNDSPQEVKPFRVMSKETWKKDPQCTRIGMNSGFQTSGPTGRARKTHRSR